MIEGLRAIAIPVADLQAAARWYGEVLAAPATETSDGGVMFHVGGYRIFLQSNGAALLPPPDGSETPAPIEPAPSPCLGYLEVDDLAAEYLRLAQCGAAFEGRPRLIDARVQGITFLDPFGNRLGLLQVDDPDERRARSQRVAEKVALRNVRDALDGLEQVNEQQRKRLYQVVAACIALAAVLLVFLASQMKDRRDAGNALTPPALAASAAAR